MNRGMFLRVADAIEKETLNGEKLGFDMNTWKDENGGCGTTCCVAGWAISLERNDLDWSVYTMSPQQEGRKVLGLEYHEAYRLFTASVGDRIKGYDYVNERRHLVPDALRWMAATEIVDWEQALDFAQKRADCMKERKA